MAVPVLSGFGAAKNEVALDEYQVRKYDAWHRHMTLAMYARNFLAVSAHKAKRGDTSLAEQPGPHENISADASGTETPHTIHRRLIALTVAEVRRLLNTIIHHENQFPTLWNGQIGAESTQKLHAARTSSADSGVQP